jgi:7-cyano-7-deazaguanine synthase
MDIKKKAVVLLSGGLDSATVLAMVTEAGFEPYAVSFDYGQRHRVELDAAKRVARAGGAVAQQVIPVGLDLIGGSALTDDIDVPKDRDVATMGDDIPVTYVPARNTVFLSLALAYAEVVGAFDIFVGANAIDYSGYPDCRPDYLKAFERMANLATKAGIEAGETDSEAGATGGDNAGVVSDDNGGGPFTIHAPLLEMTKADIIKTGTTLGVDYAITHSCYDPTESGNACGTCDSCILRKKGFEDAEVEDPMVYGL